MDNKELEKEQQSFDDQFAKGFNTGYLLQKYEPKVANILNTSIRTDNNYTEGIKAGREQHFEEEKAQLLERAKSRTTQSPSPDRDNGLDIDR